jgi:flagellar hook-basal body protein
MGYPVGANGAVSQSTPQAIQVPVGLQSTATATGAANATKSGPAGDKVFDASFGGNLNQADYVTAVSSGGASVPYTTISTTFYDSLGGAHLINVTFQPASSFAENGPAGAASVKGVDLTLPLVVTNAQGAGVTAATEYAYTITPTDGSDLGAGAGNPIVAGYMYFDQNGQFINTVGAVAGATRPVPAANLHVAGQPPSLATGDQVVVNQWQKAGANNSAKTGNGLPGNAIGFDMASMTALASAATPNALSQDGYAPGLLSNITIANDGTINGSFTNGQISQLGKVAVATFQNEQGLQRLGANQFQQSANSGLAQYGVAGTGAVGTIVSGALEQSNVVIADEFTKMILAQRSFEANSRSIATADQDLQTVIQMKSGTGG